MQMYVSIIWYMLKPIKSTFKSLPGCLFRLISEKPGPILTRFARFVKIADVVSSNWSYFYYRKKGPAKIKKQ